MSDSSTRGLERDPPDSSSTDTNQPKPAEQDVLHTTATVEHTHDGGVFAVETIEIHVHDQSLNTTDPELTASYHLEGSTAVLDTITTRPAADDTTFRPADHLTLVVAADAHILELSMVQAVYGFTDHLSTVSDAGGDQDA